MIADDGELKIRSRHRKLKNCPCQNCKVCKVLDSQNQGQDCLLTLSIVIMINQDSDSYKELLGLFFLDGKIKDVCCGREGRNQNVEIRKRWRMGVTMMIRLS